MHRPARLLVALLSAAVLLATSACSPEQPAAENRTLKIVYEKTDSFTALDTLFTKIKPEFEAAHKGVKVELQPIQANDDDYSTKLALAQQSAETAPGRLLRGHLPPALRHRRRLPPQPGQAPRRLGRLVEIQRGREGRRDGRRRQRLRRPARHRHPRASGTASPSSPRPASPCRGSPRRGTTSWMPPARSRTPSPASCRSTCTPARAPARAR